MKRAALLWMAAAILAAGCAPTPAVIEKRDILEKQDVVAPAEKAAVPAEAPPERARRPSEELELLLGGVRLLNLPDRTEPTNARPIFISLIERYPQGRWRPAAEAFIRLIDEQEAFREAGRLDRLLADTAKSEKERILQENEALRKTVRELTERAEKLQTEVLTLAKEKEEIKQDIQRMKALEIELEKRDRMLR